MDRSLAEVSGIAVPAADDSGSDSFEETPSAELPAAPVATSPPAPTAAITRAPQTRTIWVCPDEFTDVDGVCTQSMNYTFHDEKLTQDYTYTSDRRLEQCAGSDCPGSEYKDFGTDWSGTTCPHGLTMHHGKCLG